MITPRCRDWDVRGPSGCIPTNRKTRAAKRSDHLGPVSGYLAPHSITSSARAMRVGGMLRPIAVAVLKLMINSNSVASWIGRSAGLAPLRMRST